jgi:hypothetical protein
MPKNYSEWFEVEFKFVPREPEGAVLRRMMRLFAPEYGFARWPPCANLDIYLDTSDLRLYRENTPLRLRRWATPYKLKKGFTANFKIPPSPGTRLPETGVGLRRMEIKTMLSDSEALEVCNGSIVGGTLECAAEMWGLPLSSPSGLRPQIMIATQQNLYVLRPRADSGQLAVQRGKNSDLLYLTFERCIVQEVSTDEGTRLLRNGMSDVDINKKVVEIYEAELEIVAEEEELDLAHSLYLRAHDLIKQAGFEMPTKCKYSLAIEALRRCDA